MVARHVRVGTDGGDERRTFLVIDDDVEARVSTQQERACVLDRVAELRLVAQEEDAICFVGPQLMGAPDSGTAQMRSPMPAATRRDVPAITARLSSRVPN